MGLRAQEPDAEDLALSVQITGIRGNENRCTAGIQDTETIIGHQFACCIW